MDSHSTSCLPCKWLTIIRKKISIPQAAHEKSSRQPELRIDCIPSREEYVIEATKKTIEILKGAAGLVGIPLVKEILDIGLNVISTCEAINEVQERARKLKNRIAEFLLVIAKVASHTNGKPSNKLSQDVLGELQDLKNCFDSITRRLQKINKQNSLLTALLPQANLKIIDDCISDFQNAIDQFQTLRSLHAAQDFTMIQSQLEDIYGLTQIVVQKVDQVEVGVHQIQSSVNDLKAMMTRADPVGSFNPLAKIPRPPTVFFGRENVVNRIAAQLNRSDAAFPHICILAPGGMGKTSTALAVMDHPMVKKKFSDRHRFWVPCISANSSNGLLTLLAKQLGATRQTEDPLQAVLATLGETEEPRIIILDNFETPWHSEEENKGKVKDVLDALDSLPHVAIILTMRSEFPPLDHWTTEILPALNLHNSRRVYTAIDASAKNQPELDDLLEALGHLPYAITLMATRGKQSLFNPKRLLKEWREQGTTMLSQVEQCIKLSVDSKFVADSPSAVELLQILSMLPAGIYQRDIDIWVKSINSQAFATLRSAALVLTSEIGIDDSKGNHFFVLPVVQSYMHSHNLIPETVQQCVYHACCEFLAMHTSPIAGPNTSGFKDDIAAIADQETNLQALLTEIARNGTVVHDIPFVYTPFVPTSNDHISNRHLPNTRLRPEQLDAILAFSWYKRWTAPQIEIAEQVVALSRNMNESPSRRQAEASLCLANMLRQFDRYQDAADQFRETEKLFSAIGDNIEAFRSELDAIEALVWLDEFTQEALIELVSKAHSRWGLHFSNSEMKALLLLSTGYINFIWLDEKKALEELQEAERIFLSLDHLYEASRCLIHMSRCFSAFQQHDLAIEAVSNAIRQLEDMGLGTSSLMITAFKVKAIHLKGANRWDDELYQTLRTALQLSQKFGTPLHIAQTLESLADIYVRSGDWAAARLAYEVALKECSMISGYTARGVEADCRRNLEYIRTKESV